MLHAIKLVEGRVGVLSRRIARKACVVGSALHSDVYSGGAGMGQHVFAKYRLSYCSIH